MKAVLLACLLALGSLAVSLPAHADDEARIQYKKVVQAYNGLRMDPQAQLKRADDGWVTVLVVDGPHAGIWTFAPGSDTSFPSVVRRVVVERNGQPAVAMDMLCEAQKAGCDALKVKFDKLNAGLVQELRAKLK